jgi:hypothetical protein
MKRDYMDILRRDANKVTRDYVQGLSRKAHRKIRLHRAWDSFTLAILGFALGAMGALWLIVIFDKAEFMKMIERLAR